MRSQGLKLAPVTLTLIVFQVLVYCWLVYVGGSTNTMVLLNAGARSTVLIKDGQWWRLISPVFLHVGLSHLVINSVTLLYIGRYIEEFFGHWRMIVIYFVSAIFGNLASAVLMPTTISAGASTAIFGLFGAFLMLGVCFHHNVIVRVLSRTFFLFIIINIVMDIFLSGIDLVGHIGGLFGGFFIAFVVGAPLLGNINLIKRFLSGTILTVSLIILTLELK
ncbi:rhomboid family intramembrane serine protease [Limosilactobacillus sp. STM2_1]|uniref:Rhomboid family intramembrane serine protease n=1 Tax=Limosilactobacillus rudii TaxID=2759755 RepID=A0A7W3UJX8_9LACO|nr:rhomboid family intramembrane serine protease [Limosilactobacillus rudii]MBB1080127.1 rhomboid family intramembrane serine protease [Limosilactobacillus rudii]MBB1096385.1 rhomboid family intramembrane serine protease [Limosilactobacillus rudii]MCD7133614.1 rhomboid family intramembrane serine protease [Limosilactobacillus rudii]